MTAKNRMSISLSDEEVQQLDILANRFSKSRSQVIREILNEFLNSDSDRFNILVRGSGGPKVKRNRTNRRIV